ncbi:MAG: Ni/Fe hydrogenase subunit gamma [candidate division Zixibacteria bacterium]|nr:Ni/Fe hydrogenase subunit gamma [candidate division Zixibacteria bacterium]NIR64074.1 Ni/Fe hydrogenase subunit gamma [candidate division Zixibacteria bacterium]NIS15403.1 Ni/Fe hydrogenase subunit gamma [candidate division Zixibacteria bacterium]NIS45972.1 Ni/Fe hydrogenase subunit gamma [candidate division Zixibacteria bacterium]NIT51931.1 Ni/Fe hydrogenase subunit gamma [candidate division Zixibacteria bacterium]
MAELQKSKQAIGSKDNPMMPRQFRIQRFKRDTVDTFSMELKPVSGPRKFNFLPGQFNMLYVFGVGEVPISISGDPTNPEILVHTTRAVGNVTKAMDSLKSGHTIGVRGPLGTSWPVIEAEGNDVVLVAGGIGLAPLRPVMYHLLAHREHYGKIVLLYGTRTPDDILFKKELEKWRSRLDLEIHITVDRGTGSWRGNVGVVTNLIGRAPFDHLNCTAMVCGPEIMMRFSALGLQKRGVEPGDIWVSMERNMKCGIGLCGHCQMGPLFVCKDGPVFRYSEIKEIFTRREY